MLDAPDDHRLAIDVIYGNTTDSFQRASGLDRGIGEASLKLKLQGSPSLSYN
jgi:hypothetical protein